MWRFRFAGKVLLYERVPVVQVLKAVPVGYIIHVAYCLPKWVTTVHASGYARGSPAGHAACELSTHWTAEGPNSIYYTGTEPGKPVCLQIWQPMDGGA